MATTSPIIQDLIKRNDEFVTTFKPVPSIAQYAEILAAHPDSPRTCIITCCDPRVVPEFIFGLSMGEAIVIRTAGGSVGPALAGMLAIDSLAPITDVIVMRHTDCGTAYWTGEGVRQVLSDRSGGQEMLGMHGEQLQDMAFCESTGNAGDEQRLRQDIEWLKASPLVRETVKQRVVGMIYITESGKVKHVC